MTDIKRASASASMGDALPTTVTDYFAHRDVAEKNATIELFTPAAVVIDDGHSYTGRAEILAWLSTAASEYSYTSTRLGTETTADGVIVTERLEGDFPGGVVDLRSDFRLDAETGLIESLTIAP
jgi:hypothetical protein